MTDKGVTAGGKTFQTKGFALDKVVTSPLDRARQTTDLMLQKF